MTGFILALILHYSAVYNVNPVLALSVAVTESQLNPNAESATNDFGVFQLNRGSFKSYSKAQLKDPETNVRLGVRYLAQMKSECVHQKGITFLVCWNYGIQNAKHVRYPKLFPFVKKVRLIMSKFQDGERVVVKGLYDLRLDGEGIYLGVTNEPHYVGYYRIENEYGHIMRIHPDRIVKKEE